MVSMNTIFKRLRGKRILILGFGREGKSSLAFIKKFMPRIKTNSKCTTDWTRITNSLAREFANYNKLTYKDYNKLKTSGTAHDFQKLICSGRYKDINWNLIPGPDVKDEDRYQE